MNKTEQIEKLEKENTQLKEVVNKQVEVFEKLVSKAFIKDLNECKKENKNPQWLMTNYFNKQFLLTVFQEQKRTYTFKSQLEQLFFDTLYFKYQNQNAKSAYQCEYINEHSIRITIFTEQLNPATINYYNTYYNCNIPLNHKCEEVHDLQDQLDIEVF